jgi:hypothetical protein
MTDGFPDAVAKFTGTVDDALTRARRAAAEAREQATRFRAANKANVEQADSGDLHVPEVTDPALRESATQFRLAQGLQLDSFPPDEELIQAPNPPAVAQSGDDDDDFSQEQIMTSI